MADDSLINRLIGYAQTAPDAVRDPTFWKMVIGINPETEQQQNLSTGGTLSQFGAGMLQGAADIGNTVGNALDVPAHALEGVFGPLTFGGRVPTVAQAAQNRLLERQNYDAIYGGSVPAVLGRNAGQNALLASPLKSLLGGFAAAPAFNALATSGTAGRVAGNALAGAGAGAVTAAATSSASDEPVSKQMLRGAAMGATMAGVQGTAPTRAAPKSPENTPGIGSNVAPPVYSPLEELTSKAVGAPKTASAESWKQWLDGAQSRGQISKEERLDTGIDNFLANKGDGPITRAEVQAHVAANKPAVQIIDPAGGNDEHAIEQRSQELHMDLAHDYADNSEKWNRLREDHPDLPDTDDFDERFDALIEHDGAQEQLRDEATAQAADGMGSFSDENGQRYADYQLPGGDEYHERLVTLPRKAPDPLSFQTTQYRPDGWTVRTADGGLIGNFPADSEAEARALAVKHYEEAPEVVKSLGSPQYQSNHWDEPNIIAHWRANERPVTGVGGETVPSYHVEEIQSDWHQDLNAIETRDKLLAKKQAAFDAYPVADAEAKMGSKIIADPNDVPEKWRSNSPYHIKFHDASYAGYATKEEAEAALRRDAVGDPTSLLSEKEQLQLANAKRRIGVKVIASDAHKPESTEGWTRRDVGDRGFNGYHGYTLHDATGTQRGTAVMRPTDDPQPFYAGHLRSPDVFSAIPPAPFRKSWPMLTMKNAIVEAVNRGKTRVSWTPGEEQAKRFPDEDNEAGMKAFYDVKLANEVNDLLKKYGGGKVQQGQVEERPPAPLDPNKRYMVQAPYFDIPPKMIEQIKKQGFPTH